MANDKSGTSQDGEGSGAFSLMVKDPERFAQNIALMIEGLMRAANAFLSSREDGRLASESAEGIAEVVRTLSRVVAYWTAEPGRMIQAQSKLYANYFMLWTSMMQRMNGASVPAVIEPASHDKRFRDAQWTENLFFDFVKQFYLITARWADEMVDGAIDLDPHSRLKAGFYIRQITNAVAPSNFLFTNPEILRDTLDSSAENLVRGMDMLVEDIEAGDGEIRIRHTDLNQFAIGENLAVTPGKVILQNDICQLIQYEPATADVLKRPLLIVPPWINKFYILDLTAEKSFVKWAVDAGHTVFVISWINPDERQAEKSFEHYMREGILESLGAIEAATGETEVNAVGYCVGGTLLSYALACMASVGDKRIASATLLATQVDFTHAGDLKVFIDEDQITAVERKMSVRGYLEGKDMTAAFNMLRSNDLIWPYVVNNYFRGRTPPPFDLLYWNADATRMPAANHSFYLRNFYLDNKLAGGDLSFEGNPLSLSDVTIPIYNLATREDHIAPSRSVYFGSSFFGGPVTFVLSGSGHIAGVINPPVRGKYQYWTGPAPHGDDVDAWLAQADEVSGSWWPHWQNWVTSLDARRVEARPVGGHKIKPIEAAPGSYVKVRA
jgi:polyhydroxyalkanoate synthase